MDIKAKGQRVGLWRVKSSKLRCHRANLIKEFSIRNKTILHKSHALTSTCHNKVKQYNNNNSNKEEESHTGV